MGILYAVFSIRLGLTMCCRVLVFSVWLSVYRIGMERRLGFPHALPLVGKVDVDVDALEAEFWS